MTKLRTIACVATLLLLSCAKGFDSGSELVQGLQTPGSFAGFPSPTAGTTGGMAAGASGMGAGGTAGAMAGAGSYVGEACTRGDMRACTCAATNTMGIQSCLFDATSPTQGTFSECAQCAAPPAGGTAGDASSGSGGAGGTTGGAGGTTGGAGGTTGGAGGSSGTSGAGGTGGAGGAGGTGGGSSCSGGCSQPCFPIGVLACCRATGSCGCTWAPGAYCF